MGHLDQAVNGISVPQVVHSSPAMISLERNTTSVEHLAEELVHSIGAE